MVERNGGKQLGLLANLTQSPGKAGDAARKTTFEDLAPRSVTVPQTNGAAPQRPLHGVTVVESATIIAAPLGASVLADLGARVIKIEPLGGDPFRSMFHGFGASKCNAGKESICLDLKSPAGQACRAVATRRQVRMSSSTTTGMGVPREAGHRLRRAGVR